MANADVLVLDEPTSALDPATEREVLDGYMRAMHGRTIIVITHRAAVAAAADRVFALGGIVFEDIKDIARASDVARSFS